MFGSDNPSGGISPSIPRPAPDSRGVITYSDYQVVIARSGDTLDSVAARIGISGDELAKHNGLPIGYKPRDGEVLALPRDVGGIPATTPAWTPDIAINALDDVSATPGPASTTGPVRGSNNPFNNGQQSNVIAPVRHRVLAGETAFSIARLYGVSVTALADWNGLDSNMTLRENQEVLIPVIDRRVERTAPTPAPAPVVNDPGTNSVVAAPPSAQQPLPENQDVADVVIPQSPNLVEDRTPPGASRKFLAPVAGASVLRPYATSGSSKNEGIDYAAAAGSEVRAVEDGEVALISQSVGGLGTIVLVRHPDDLMSVYGRVSDVTLEKGDKIQRGQKLGVIANGTQPNLHFEIRRGTASVDPAPYF